MTRILAIAILLAAPASAATNPVGGGKHDTSQPIEINADQLEVLQEDSKAIFSGHVVAIQGEVRLKSDKMTVYYAKKDEAQPQKSAAPEESGSIRKIDVEGSVFLSTPEETASGTSGVYDVEKGQILLNDNVVLTRGSNTLKGSNLVYDFAAGKSRLVGAGSAKQMPWEKPQRVRGLFVPEKKADKK